MTLQKRSDSDDRKQIVFCDDGPGEIGRVESGGSGRILHSNGKAKQPRGPYLRRFIGRTELRLGLKLRFDPRVMVRITGPLNLAEVV